MRFQFTEATSYFKLKTLTYSKNQQNFSFFGFGVIEHKCVGNCRTSPLKVFKVALFEAEVLTTHPHPLFLLSQSIILNKDKRKLSKVRKYLGV